MSYGTLTTLDTLRAVRAATVYEYGEDNVYQGIADARDAHNVLTAQMIADLVEVTTDNARNYGAASDPGEMEAMDQYGSPDSQVTSAGVDVGFPLRKYGRALQWTKDAFYVLTVADMIAQFDAVLLADRLNIQKQIKRAFYGPTNTTFKDVLYKGINLPLKAFLNADSAAIPLGPNGETFTASSHTHYSFAATFAEAAFKSLLDNVAEHRNDGAVVGYINSADEATVRAFTAFVPAQVQSVTPSMSSAYADQPLTMENQKNRFIGVFNGYDIWVKPWVIATYPVAVRLGAGVKPLVFRVRAGNSPAAGGNMMLLFDDEAHPLRCKAWGRDFGISAWTRDAAAAAYMGNGSAYTAPTIT
jgi:hypothetical protein